MSESRLDPAAWRQLFSEARSHNGWLDRPVAPELLQELYAQLKMGPTSMNCAPLRLLFLCTPQAQARLLPHLLPGNVEKTRCAPVTVLLAYDRQFQKRLPDLFPHRPTARGIFDANPALREATAFRNSSLQGAYLMLAARGLGLDCGPMSGFDAEGVEAEFFGTGSGSNNDAGEQLAINFICNLGYGDPAALFGRLPRLSFDQACKVL
ncbi:malonic semialdehyde reductase [Paucibacter sp. AS339]|uniref:malonic semialdehyde reductase n=1 Tax=Paucibacter hankyongi TaxID=3133434 RepID=UPI0030B53476